MKPLIIFGTGQIAELAYYYFTNDTKRKVICFTVDAKYMNKKLQLGLPLIDFKKIEMEYSPKKHDMFVALSYSDMNKLRAAKYHEAKTKGYNLVSYVSSKATVLTEEIGENCFILEDNTIQPFVKIGNNVTLWSGNHIGHHSIIDNNNFISSHVVVSGGCRIKNNCFLGVNSTLRNEITIGSESVIGAGAWINKDIDDKSVYLAPVAEKYKRTSDELKSL